MSSSTIRLKIARFLGPKRARKGGRKCDRLVLEVCDFCALHLQLRVASWYWTLWASPSEVHVQRITKLKTCPPQARLHRCYREVERMSCFFGGKSFHVAKLKDDPVRWSEAADRSFQDCSQFFPRIKLFRARAPVFQLARSLVVLIFVCFV